MASSLLWAQHTFAFLHGSAWTDRIAVFLEDPTHLVIGRVVATLGVLLGGWLLTKIFTRSLESSARRTAQRQSLDEWQTRALVSRAQPVRMAFKFTMGAIVFLGLLAVWGLQAAFTSMLTAAGFAGIVIGLAASNTLSNLIAGFIIFYNNPFNIGDWVSIEGEEGIILDVKPGATVLQTWDGEKVTLPNRVVEGANVKNFSHERRLRRRFVVGIDYSTDIEKAREILLETISGHPEVLKEPPPQVIGKGFGDSCINLEVRFWVAPLRAQIMFIQTWFMQEVQRRFAHEGIVIPFPQRTIVHRYAHGDPPEHETISRLAYDPANDSRPFPGPPIKIAPEGNSVHGKQAQHPSSWFGMRRKPAPRPTSTSQPDLKPSDPTAAAVVAPMDDDRKSDG